MERKVEGIGRDGEEAEGMERDWEEAEGMERDGEKDRTKAWEEMERR